MMAVALHTDNGGTDDYRIVRCQCDAEMLYAPGEKNCVYCGRVLDDARARPAFLEQYFAKLTTLSRDTEYAKITRARFRNLTYIFTWLEQEIRNRKNAPPEEPSDA